MGTTRSGNSVGGGCGRVPLGVGIHIFRIRDVVHHQSASLKGLRVDLNAHANTRLETNKSLELINILSDNVRSGIEELSRESHIGEDSATSTGPPSTLIYDGITRKKVSYRVSLFLANIIIHEGGEVGHLGTVIIDSFGAIVAQGNRISYIWVGI